jgi:hypothetical protein
MGCDDHPCVAEATLASASALRASSGLEDGAEMTVEDGLGDFMGPFVVDRHQVGID